MKNGMFRQILALLLCFAMILPNFTGLVSATATEDSSASSQTQSATAFNKATLDSLDYNHGKVSEWLETDCGNGLQTDAVNNKSYLQVAASTDYTSFEAYCNALKNNSTYTAADSKMALANAVSYSRFVSADKSHTVYAYFLKKLNEARVVVDTHKDMTKVYSNGFAYAGGTAVTDTLMVMYGLSMAENGYDYSSKTGFTSTRRNCGALIVIRMPDNSLFIHDGGDIQQWSDTACANFMQFCRDLTGVPEGQKVVLNTWFVSHAHSDHYKGFPRFLSLYQDQVDLKNVMYNIDDERAGSTRDMGPVMQMISTAFPSVKYYKPHTGEQFTINGIQFDVMYTQEDRFLAPSQLEGAAAGASNVLKFDSGTSDKGGTYRPECFEDKEYDDNVDGTPEDYTYTESDFNDTTTVLKVTFPAGKKGITNTKTSILYGDVNRVDTTIINIYGETALATDIMMVPHHGHDSHPELVSAAKSKIYLYTQTKRAIFDSEGKLAVEGTTEIGTFRPALLRNYKGMLAGLSTGTTYWEGDETAYIFFKEGHAKPTRTTTETMTQSMSANGFTVFTETFTAEDYTGWTIDTGIVSGTSFNNIHEYLVDSPASDEWHKDIQTNDEKVRFNLVDNKTLIEKEQYVLVHNATDLMVMYDAATTAAAAKEAINNGKEPPSPKPYTVKVPLKGDATADDPYFSSGTKKGLFFSRYMRDSAVWMLNIFENSGFTLTALKDNDGKQIGCLGGVVQWHHAFFQKGYSDGNGHGSFWQSMGYDSTLTGYKNSNWYYHTLTPYRSKSIYPDGNHVEYVAVEFFSDNTCVIYCQWTKDNNYNVRFVTVDEDGFLTRSDTFTAAQLADAYTAAKNSADFASFKFRLYKKEPQPKWGYNADGTANSSAHGVSVGAMGDKLYTVAAGTSSTAVMNYIDGHLTVQTTERDIACNQNVAFSGTIPVVGYYWLDFGATPLNTDKPGTYTATIKYVQDDKQSVAIETITINVQQAVELGAVADRVVPNSGTAAAKSGLTDNVYVSVDEQGNVTQDCVIKMKVSTYGAIHQNISVNVGMLTCTANTVVTYPDGTTANCVAGTYVDTNVPDGTVYTNLQLTYAGIDLGNTFTLTIQDISATDYPAYPEEGSVKVDKSGTAQGINFKNSGIAQIQLSATGIPMNKGVDLIIVVDMSSSMKFLTDSAKQPEYNEDGTPKVDRRIEHMLDSLDAVVAELEAKNADVRIAMSDFGDLDSYAFEKSVIDTNIYHQSYLDANFSFTDNLTYEFYNHLNFVMNVGDIDNKTSTPYDIANSKYNFANPSYMGVITPYVYTGNGSPTASAFQDVRELDMTKIRKKMLENVDKSIGTNYDIGLEYAYQMGYAIQQRNIAEGKDRDIVCIFMSDGAAMQYNYFSGNTSSAPWVNWLSGNADDLVSNYDYYLTNQTTALPELNAIKAELLKQLKAGTLIMPNYNRNATTDRFRYHIDFMNSKSKDEGQPYSDDYFYSYMKDAGYVLDWQYLYDIVKVNLGQINNIQSAAGDPVSTTADAYLGASTAEEYGALKKENKMHPELIQLFTSNYNGTTTKKHDHDNFGEAATEANPGYTDCEYYTSKLLNPYYADYLAQTSVKQYYTASPDATDFFSGMKSILGRDIGWNEFIQIAYKNRASLTYTPEGGTAITGLPVIRSLVIKLRSQAGGSTATHYTVSPYHYFYNANGKNWLAEAIKGETDKLYPVINKYAKNDSNSPFSYSGDVKNNFAGDTTFVKNADGTTTALPLSGQDYISGFKGLGMDLYTISFSIATERQITSEVATSVLRNIATGPNYFFSASDSTGLTNALKSIVSTMSKGASQAYFVDTLGTDYDLFTGFNSLSHNTDQKAAVGDPTIRVLEYTLDANGNRTDNYRVIETVTFNTTEGFKAKSDQIYTVDANFNPVYSDIWGSDGVIKGRYFYYNTNKEAKKIDLTGDGVGDYTLNGESFFWVIGQIGQTEMVLEYQVYLTGSFDTANRFAGVYDTNKEAVLHYINYRGVNCELDTISPSFPWDQGRVGVAFYLVDENGKPIVNQTTGATGDFDNAVKLTRPVYEVLELNSDGTTYTSLDVSANTYLPNGYTLYKANANYSVKLNSNGDGSWTITDDSSTTYVTGYDGDEFSNIKDASTAYESSTKTQLSLNDYGTSNTVVWFAVYVSQALTVPDTVVVDYGLPVDIHVMTNDILFENNGTLIGVGKELPKAVDENGEQTATETKYLKPEHFANVKSNYQTSVGGTFGKASVVNNVVHYEMTKMGMNTTEKFVYAVDFTGSSAVGADGYYFDTVTIIPATTIYYEDDFLTYNTYEYNGGNADNTDRASWTNVKEVKDENGKLLWDSKAAYNWLDVGTKIEGAHQSEDRPGSFNYSNIDADNLYGYDPVYKTSSTYSLGSAKKVTVGKTNGPSGRETTAEAEFSFYGTGFDVISLTSCDTGVIVVQVFKETDTTKTAYKTFNVDTYYGYKYENGKWEVDTNSKSSDALYQVPVIKAEDLPYGQYTVRISVVYSTYFDHKNTDKSNVYDFYLDAIRIYDPAGSAWDGTTTTNPTLKDDEIIGAYEDDAEFAPTYEELRNLLISKDSFDNEDDKTVSFQGVVFIDGCAEVDDISEGNHKVATYMNYGPNNEVYLAPDQAIAFKLSNSAAIKEFHIAMKKAGIDGIMTGSTKVKIFTTDMTADKVNATTIETATDLYYDFTSMKGKTIIIQNAGSSTDGILSITNVKMVKAPIAGGSRNIADYVSSSAEQNGSVLDALVIDKAENPFILAGANTVLGGELAMNFFINPADLNGTDYYAEITHYAEDGVVTTTVPYADWEVRTNYLVVTQKGLAARQMADKIEVVIYNGDGTPASDVWTDSIRDYAMRILENQDDECKTLIVDMLNYGAAAQTYFGYNTDDLANNQLSETQQGYATTTVNCVDQRVQGDGYHGSTLTLKDRIMLSMYFNNITPDMYAVVSFTDHNGNAHETRVEGSAFCKYNSTVYGVVVDDLVVADGDQLVTVTVYDADGNVVASAKDTVNSYVARQMSTGSIYEMVAKFTTSAYAHFH